MHEPATGRISVVFLEPHCRQRRTSVSYDCCAALTSFPAAHQSGCPSPTWRPVTSTLQKNQHLSPLVSAEGSSGPFQPLNTSWLLSELGLPWNRQAGLSVGPHQSAADCWHITPTAPRGPPVASRALCPAARVVRVGHKKGSLDAFSS